MTTLRQLAETARANGQTEVPVWITGYNMAGYARDANNTRYHPSREDALEAQKDDVDFFCDQFENADDFTIDGVPGEDESVTVTDETRFSKPDWCFEVALDSVPIEDLELYERH